MSKLLNGDASPFLAVLKPQNAEIHTKAPRRKMMVRLNDHKREVEASLMSQRNRPTTNNMVGLLPLYFCCFFFMLIARVKSEMMIFLL